jgi:hypothetical protein
MSNFGFDPFWRWLDLRPSPEDLPGFRVRPADAAPVGLAGWQPRATAATQPAPESAPFATEAASQPWSERSTGPNSFFEGGSESYWPWLRAPTDDVSGLHRWQPPAKGAALFAPDNTPEDTEAAPRPWWERPTGPGKITRGRTAVILALASCANRPASGLPTESGQFDAGG